MASRAKVVAIDAPVETIIPATLQVIPASLFATEPKTNQLGPAGVLGSLVNSRGLRLACYYWPVRLFAEGCRFSYNIAGCSNNFAAWCCNVCVRYVCRRISPCVAACCLCMVTARTCCMSCCELTCAPFVHRAPCAPPTPALLRKMRHLSTRKVGQALRAAPSPATLHCMPCETLRLLHCSLA